MGEIATLFATLGAKTGGLEGGLKTANAALQKTASVAEQSLQRAALGTTSMATAISSAFGVLTGHYEQLGNMLRVLPGIIGTAAGAMGDFIGKSISDTVRYADEVSKLSQKIGESAQFTSSFIEASSSMRVSQESVNQTLTVFSRNLGNATDAEGLAMTGGKGVAGILKEMGISAQDATGKTRSLAELLPEVSDVMQRLGPGTQATAYATQLFGRSGTDLLPILLEGGKRLRELQQAAIDSGLAMSNEGVKGMKALGDSVSTLNDKVATYERNLTVQFGPVLTRVISTLSDLSNIQGSTGHSTDQLALAIESNARVTAFWRSVLDGSAKSMDAFAPKVGFAALRMEEYRQELEAASKGNREAASSLNNETMRIAEQTMTSHQLTAAQRDLIQLGDRLREGTAGNVASFHEFSDAGQAVVQRDQELANAADKVTAAHDRLKHSADLVSQGMGHVPQALDAAAKAELAYALASGDATVADVEKKLAAEALTQAYVKHKLTLKQVTDAGIALKEGNTVEPWFALLQAGLKTDPALLKIVKDYREIEAASGTSTQSVMGHADALKIVTGSYMKAATGTQTYEQALAAYEVAQIKGNKALSDTREQYDKGAISVEDYALAKAKDTIADQAARTALDAAKKSADAGAGGLVTYSKIVDTAAHSADVMAGSVKNVADQADLMAQKATAAAMAAANLKPTQIGLGGGLPSEVTMHTFDTAATTTAAGEIPAGAAAGITANQQQAIDAMTAMATGMQDAFKVSWGIKSPSTVAAGYATDIDTGFASGATAGMGPVVLAFDGIKGAFNNMINGMVTAASDPAPWVNAGLIIDKTLAQSIRDNSGAVAAAIKAMIANAISAGLAGAGGPRGYGNNP